MSVGNEAILFNSSRIRHQPIFNMWDDDSAFVQQHETETVTSNLGKHTTKPIKQLKNVTKDAESFSSEDALGDFEEA